jgi:hypothetical protein
VYYNYSLVFGAEQFHDNERDDVKANIEDTQRNQTLSHILRRVEGVQGVDALVVTSGGLAALVLGVVFVEIVKFIDHQGLIAVFEDGKVLELYQPDGDIVLVHEETGKQHEGDDQHRGQGHSQLLV